MTKSEHTNSFQFNMDKCVCGLGDFRSRTTLKNYIHKAAFAGCVKCVQWLIDIGINVNTRDDYGEIPLHHAARHTRVNVVRQLLHHKSSVDVKNVAGAAPLFLATLYMDSDSKKDLFIIKMLLDHGANTEEVEREFHLLDHRGLAVRVLAKRRQICRKVVIVFMGIRRKLLSVRDTHQIIGKLLWSTRFDPSWWN